MGLHQTKKRLHIKGNNKKVMRQFTGLEKILANITFDRRLIFHMYEEFKQLEKANNPIFKTDKGPEEHCSKGNINGRRCLSID